MNLIKIFTQIYSTRATSKISEFIFTKFLLRTDFKPKNRYTYFLKGFLFSLRSTTFLTNINFLIKYSKSMVLLCFL
jgi:hypothetical protein